MEASKPMDANWALYSLISWTIAFIAYKITKHPVVLFLPTGILIAYLLATAIWKITGMGRRVTRSSYT
jgi:hypothetical protein